jgi:hypothetical protein
MVTEALVCWCDCASHVGYRSAHVRAIDQDIVRTWFYVWSLVGCPLIGWSAAVFGTHGEGGVAKFVFLFVGIPALLALAGARLFGRSIVDAVVGATVAGALGGLTWFLTILWLASQGVLD